MEAAVTVPHNIAAVMCSLALKSVASATRPATADDVREVRHTATARCKKGTSRRQDEM
jgi:hypothetical protein